MISPFTVLITHENATNVVYDYLDSSFSSSFWASGY